MILGSCGRINSGDADSLLGSYPFSVSQSATYKQVFAGVANGVPNIHRIVIDGTFAYQNPEDFSVGTVLIDIDSIFTDGFE